MFFLLLTMGFMTEAALIGGGSVFTFPSLAMLTMAALLTCLITTGCLEGLVELTTAVIDQGSRTLEGIVEWTIDLLRNVVHYFPATPAITVPHPQTVASEAQDTRTKPAVPNRAVIGEGMGRVLAAAGVYGATTFPLPEPDRQYNQYELMKLNAEWINTMMDEGRTILDIGSDERPSELSKLH
jgi:hypothetical protein